MGWHLNSGCVTGILYVNIAFFQVMSDIKKKAIRELQLEEELGKCSTALLLDLVMLEFTG